MLRPCGLSYFGPDVGASTHYHCTAPEFPPPPQTIFHARLLGYHQSACQNAILAATLQSSLRSNGWNVHEVKCYANVKQHVLHDSFRLYYPISICERLRRAGPRFRRKDITAEARFVTRFKCNSISLNHLHYSKSTCKPSRANRNIPPKNMVYPVSASRLIIDRAVPFSYLHSFSQVDR